MNSQVHNYLQNQLVRAAKDLEQYLNDKKGHPYKPRYLFEDIKKCIDDFIAGKTEVRIYGIPGLRGIGKTTLVAQIYKYILSKYPNNLLYISVDQITELLQSNLYATLLEFQNIIGTQFSGLTKPYFLFIDEIHFDSRWPSVLKWIYDGSRNVFVICTGSSALSLQAKASDLARRIIYKKMYPMNFTEYINLKTHKAAHEKSLITPISIPSELSGVVREAVLYSPDANACYNKLKSVASDIKDYWLSVDKMEIDKYLRYGTMPFAIHEENENTCAYLANEIIDRVIEKDLPELRKFNQNTLSRAKHILLMTAGSDEVSFTSFAKNLTDISIVTLMELFDAFEKAEMLIRAHPYGSVFKKVRKPSKYHFMSPALRLSLLRTVESNAVFSKYLGKFLEDIVALSVYRHLREPKLSHLDYDSAKNGADFIIQMGMKNIALEVGYGKKGIKQVINSMKKHRSAYGMVVSRDPLEFIESENIIKIPLETFLLL